MIYVDTSAWIAHHTTETATAAVQSWFAQQVFSDLACSEWVKTEYASGLSLKMRRGELTDAQFSEAHQVFAELCVAGPVWMAVEKQDFFEAARLCVDFACGLRAGDALHLAVALRTRCRGFLSLDGVLNKNAARCGLHLIEL